MWAQIGVFIVWPFLTQMERNVWLSLAKVLPINKEKGVSNCYGIKFVWNVT